jgi:hypothetical protein
MTTTAIPVRDLLAGGDCTAACLLAVAEEPCTCRCGSQFHSALVEVPVHAGEPGWWVLLGLSAPRTGVTFQVREEIGGVWAAVASTATKTSPPPDLSAAALHAQHDFTDALVRAARCDNASFTTDDSGWPEDGEWASGLSRWGVAYGFRARQEAWAAAVIFAELLHGGTGNAVLAVRMLADEAPRINKYLK